MSSKHSSMDRRYHEFMINCKHELMNEMSEQDIFDTIYFTFEDFPEYMIDCIEEIERAYHAEIGDAQRQLKKFGKMKKQFHKINEQDKICKLHCTGEKFCDECEYHEIAYK